MVNNAGLFTIGWLSCGLDLEQSFGYCPLLRGRLVETDLHVHDNQRSTWHILAHDGPSHKDHCG
jgi:hypothetical protein